MNPQAEDFIIGGDVDRSSLLLNRSFEFFTSLILQLYNFFLVFLYFLFQLKFSLCSCIALLTSVSILMTSILNYLTGKSLISFGFITGVRQEKKAQEVSTHPFRVPQNF